MKIKVELIVKTTTDIFKDKDGIIPEEDNVAMYVQNEIQDNEGLAVVMCDGYEMD